MYVCVCVCVCIYIYSVPKTDFSLYIYDLSVFVNKNNKTNKTNKEKKIGDYDI